MIIPGFRAEIVKTKEANADELSQKVLDTLIGLKELNSSYFGQWYEKAYSKKTALSKPVEFSYEFIHNVVVKSWDKQFPEIGARISFWNEQHSQISFNIGITSTVANLPPNNVILKNRANFTGGQLEQIKILLKKIWNIKTIAIFEA